MTTTTRQDFEALIEQMASGAVDQPIRIAKPDDDGPVRAVYFPIAVFEELANKQGLVVDWGKPDAFGIYSPRLRTADDPFVDAMRRWREDR